MRTPIANYIKHHTLILDGGQGTDLEERGVDIGNPLWSTLPFLTRDEVQLQCIREMYRSFKKAGANALMTVTYQASYQSLLKYSNGKVANEQDYKDFLNYIISFTEKECISSNDYLIGSVGPYAGFLGNGVEYSGDYGPEEIDFLEYYRPQVSHFATTDRIDVIGVETIPNVDEFRSLLTPEFAALCGTKPYYISITTDNEGNLRDGTSVRDLCRYIRQSITALPSSLLFLGVNCVDFTHCTSIVTNLNNNLSGSPLKFRAAYPNSGEIYDGTTYSWSPNPNSASGSTWENLTSSLLEERCVMIGGCCRSSSRDIALVSRVVQKQPGA
ncbi:LADA_0H16402g1_1 [Lachancea dasiensis]|uniref:LADA_0H16402g1_1 n=1 Tax=Lachancea dasiensis TaxID=1072105 RepID=A0A1G4K586_9SACH|nr:LADA_0H16402g1_1 [Lachancea dasiensis]